MSAMLCGCYQTVRRRVAEGARRRGGTKDRQIQGGGQGPRRERRRPDTEARATAEGDGEQQLATVARRTAAIALGGFGD
ncbi:hypothetical protein IAQ61_005471 [Plenodomus lingam]|uniref:uncharacterized protein n=1 Tax=Leptosphaeria maculans TaxID=5022 RepID=UPI0033267404|nr:hypothetical protein IAQ61_005471 [Plenodomus lingam]